MTLGTLVDRAANENPNGIAAISGESKLTWYEFSDRIARLAGGIRELGLLPGARVALLAGLSQASVELLCALGRAGLVAVPLNTRLNRQDIQYILRDADVDALIFDADFRDFAVSIAAEMPIRHLISSSGARDDRWVDYLQLRGAEAAVRYEWTEDELALILYTGGTTGRSKGVMLSAGALATHAASVHAAMNFSSNTVFIQTMPIFHVAGHGFLSGVIQGAGTLVFRPDAGPTATYEEIRAHGVNAFCAVPTSIVALLASPNRDADLLRRIEKVGYGGSPISSVFLEQAIAAMPNAKFVQIYGLTETGATTALPPQNHVLSGDGVGKLQSAGLALPHAVVRIVDDRGVEQPSGSPGEIVISGGGLTHGYWRNPGLTEELYRDGWLRTGDVGVKDEDGFITIVDRSKDMIKTGGENVFSVEVENVIATHPAVETCAVIGLPHPVWGEAVHAVVVCRKGKDVSPEEIVEYCRSRMTAFKCPKTAHIRQEPLPLSSIGKVLKNQLRAEAVARQAVSMAN
jgi:long-chain acyl-CoA synthetase